MNIAIICTALLALLVFGLGLAVSLTRNSTETVIGYKDDPADSLYKMVRAHANACEYVPTLAVLILLVAARDPAPWVVWTIIAATVLRYVHAAGMILSPTLAKPHPLRFVGALGTYVAGFLLIAAVVRSL